MWFMSDLLHCAKTLTMYVQQVISTNLAIGPQCDILLCVLLCVQFMSTFFPITENNDAEAVVQ